MSLKPRVEVAFGGRWYDDPATMTWTDVTGYSELVPQPRVRATRGRSGSMDRTPQPGSFSVTFNGLDGAFIPENPASPFFPDVQPGLPIRLSLQDDTGTWVPVFTGFCTDFTPGVSPGSINGATNWTVVDVSAVDGWARVMQAGKRVTYRDRVLTDLASGRGLSWITGQLVEESRTSGVSTGSVVAQDRQAFGFGWWALASGGLLAWSQPGAAGVLAESGAGDSSGMFLMTNPGGSLSFVSTAGFASDRYGGRWQRSYSDTTRLVQSAAAQPGGGGNDPQNFVRQQVSVGRPPKQLLPASALVASGWTASTGTVTDVDALTLTWPARSESFDPVSKARTTVVDGPPRALVWSSPAVVAKAVTVDSFPVTAGKVYCAHLGTGVGSNVRLSLRWLDSGGATISETSTAFVSSSSTGPAVLASKYTTQLVAPANAVAARVVLVAQGTSTIEAHGVGVYEAIPTGYVSNTGPVWLTPARWWPHGASDHVYAWLQVPLTDPSAIGVVSATRLWLHGQVQVDGWTDGQIHSLGWNVNPSTGGEPKVWVDDIEAAVSWRLSYPGRDVGYDQGITAIPAAPQWSLGVGNGSRNETSVFIVNPTQPSTVDTAWAVIGTDRWNASPDDALVTRWHTPYGAPATVAMQGTTPGTTDVLMGQLLDALAWPQSQRDLDPGAVSSTLTWTDGADLGDYSTQIGDLAAAEFGWAGVDGSGRLVWRKRRFYDPDGDGTATAVAHLTYKLGEAGKVPYQPGLGQSYSDDKVKNQTVVTGGGATITALVEDRDSQDRIGIRRQELASTAWDQADVDAVAQEAAALTGLSLVPDKVTVICTADDPALSVILGLNPADVVLVDIPRSPAADLTVSALVGQIDLTTDGILLTAQLSLGPCPVTAVDPPWTGPVFLGLDAEGPYVDPSRAESGARVSQDAEGFYYDPAGSLSVAVDADGPYVLEDA